MLLESWRGCHENSYADHEHFQASSMQACCKGFSSPCIESLPGVLDSFLWIPVAGMDSEIIRFLARARRGYMAVKKITGFVTGSGGHSAT